MTAHRLMASTAQHLVVQIDVDALGSCRCTVSSVSVASYPGTAGPVPPTVRKSHHEALLVVAEAAVRWVLLRHDVVDQVVGGQRPDRLDDDVCQRDRRTLQVAKQPFCSHREHVRHRRRVHTEQMVVAVQNLDCCHGLRVLARAVRTTPNETLDLSPWIRPKRLSTCARWRWDSAWDPRCSRWARSWRCSNQRSRHRYRLRAGRSVLHHGCRSAVADRDDPSVPPTAARPRLHGRRRSVRRNAVLQRDDHPLAGIDSRIYLNHLRGRLASRRVRVGAVPHRQLDRMASHRTQPTPSPVAWEVPADLPVQHAGLDLLRRVGGRSTNAARWDPGQQHVEQRGTLLGALCFLVVPLALRPTSSESRAQGQRV